MDLVRGVANPLKQMAVAATASGSYVNGTYKALRGWYEDGTPRYHWGIDLAAKEGTPVVFHVFRRHRPHRKRPPGPI